MWFLSGLALGIFLGMFTIAIFAWKSYERGRKDAMLECQKLCEEKIKEKTKIIHEISEENKMYKQENRELKTKIKELGLQNSKEIKQ